MQNSNHNQSWIQQPPQFVYEWVGEQAKAKSKIDILSKLYKQNEDIEICIQFQDYSSLQKFRKCLHDNELMFNQKTINNQADEIEEIFQQVHLRNLRHIKKLYSNLKHFQCFFESAAYLAIFINFYKDRINKMQIQYNYCILGKSNTLIIYANDSSQKTINSFFVNQISDMKKQLIIVYMDNRNEYYQKLLYSKNASQKLSTQNIGFALLNRNQSMLFHSNKYKNTYQISQIIKKSLTYHVSIIKLSQKYIDIYILQQIFKVIMRYLRPTYLQLQQKQDKITIQFNIQKACIIISDIHQVFDQFYKTINKKLSQIQLLIQFSGCSYKQFKKIIKNQQYSKFIYTEIKYRKIFILVEKSDIEENKIEVIKFCKDFSQLFREKYKLVMYFYQYMNDKEKLIREKNRIKNLMQFFSVYCPEFDLIDQQLYPKIIIQPKQYGDHFMTEHPKQIQQFMKCILFQKSPHISTLNNKSFQSFQLPKLQIQKYKKQPNESVKIINQSKQSIQKHNNNNSLIIEQQFNQIINKIQKLKITKQKPKINWKLEDNIKFNYPLLVQLQNIPYKKSKRNFPLQDQITQIFNKKLRINTIQINNKIQLAQINYYNRIQFLQQIFKQNHTYKNNQVNYQLKKYSQVVRYQQIQKLQKHSQTFLCFINQDLNVFIPYYYIQVVG